MNLSSASNLLVQLEILQDRRDLAALGLFPEEIEGYVLFFIDNFFPEKETKDASIRLSVPGVQEDPREIS